MYNTTQQEHYICIFHVPEGSAPWKTKHQMCTVDFLRRTLYANEYICQMPLAQGDGLEPNANGNKKRKASSKARPTTATAPKQRSKSNHKAACRAGREIVAKMSKKDPAR